jgi:hypothetical protein
MQMTPVTAFVTSAKHALVATQGWAPYAEGVAAICLPSWQLAPALERFGASLVLS